MRLAGREWRTLVSAVRLGGDSYRVIRPSRPIAHASLHEASHSPQMEPLREDPLFAGIARGDYVYFVHSFAAPVGPDTLAASDYGGRFTAAVRRANFRGVQFHPERSAAVGARLIANFVALRD